MQTLLFYFIFFFDIDCYANSSTMYKACDNADAVVENVCQETI